MSRAVCAMHRCHFCIVSSVGSSGQLIPRFFFAERERACVSSAAIFGTITHAPGMILGQKVLERHGRVFTRTSISARYLDYSCRDYLLVVVSAPQTFWTLVPNFIWDHYVYTSKIWSAVPKNGQHGAKNVPCRADF